MGFAFTYTSWSLWFNHQFYLIAFIVVLMVSLSNLETSIRHMFFYIICIKGNFIWNECTHTHFSLLVTFTYSTNQLRTIIIIIIITIIVAKCLLYSRYATTLWQSSSMKFQYYCQMFFSSILLSSGWHHLLMFYWLLCVN